MIRHIYSLAAIVVLIAFAISCAGLVLVKTAPPPAKTEMKSARPGPSAVWIDGNWKWQGNKWMWKQGHWEKNPRGKWVKGRWKKRKGEHVWVPGKWKR